MTQEVAPTVPTEGGGDGRFRVKPQTRFDTLGKVNDNIRTSFMESVIVATRAREGSPLQSTVDGQPRLVIDELVYPGNDVDPNGPGGKWVYLVHADSHVIMAELYCVGGLITTSWKWRDFPQANDPPSKRDLNVDANWQTFDERRTGVPVTSLKPGEDPTVVRAFLSPYQLDARGMDLLLHAQSPHASSFDLSDALVQPVWPTPKPGYVALVDPFAWAVETHEQYYEPRLDAYQDYALSEEMQAKLSIAGTLKAWIANGDPADVEDELRRKPDDFFNEYKNAEGKLRRSLNEAAAYLASCLDSPEHYVVEQCLLDRTPWRSGSGLLFEDVSKDLGRSYAIQHMCVVTDRLSQSAVGVEFLDMLLQADDRSPSRFIFGTATGVGLLGADYFSSSRWASFAGMGLMKELLPTYIALRTRRGMNVTDLEEQAIKLFEKFNVGLSIDTRKLVYESLAASDPGLLSGKLKKKIKNYVWKNKNAAVSPQRAAEIIHTVDAAEGSARLKLGKAVFAVQLVVEIANVSMAIASFRQDPNYRSGLSLLCSGVDFTAMVLEFSALMSNLPWAAAQAAKRRVAVLAVISGALDCFDNVMKASDSAQGRDYGQAVGQGLAAAGAAAVAVGGAMSVYGVFAALGAGAAAGAEVGVCGGPLPAIVGAAGGLLLAGGTLLAAYLKLNAYEIFAQRSFLGLHHDAPARSFNWSPVSLPAPTVVQELEAMMALMSNYRVSATGSSGPNTGAIGQNGIAPAGYKFNYLEIFPGNSDPHEVMELKIDFIYGEGLFNHGDTFSCTYHVKFNEQRPAFVTGNTILREQEWTVERRSVDDPTPSKFRVPLQPLTLTRNGKAIWYSDYPGQASCQKCVVSTRLLGRPDGGSSLFSTPVSKVFQLDVIDKQSASSIDPDFQK